LGDAVIGAGLKARELIVRVRHGGKGVWEGPAAD